MMDGAQMDWDGLFNAGTLSMLVPIVALIGWIATRAMKHRERMAMIEKGMNPDLATGTAVERERR